MSQLLEQILERENMMTAYKKVKSNGGAGGIDGISTKDVRDYLVKNWSGIREQIRQRNTSHNR